MVPLVVDAKEDDIWEAFLREALEEALEVDLGDLEADFLEGEREAAMVGV